MQIYVQTLNVSSVGLQLQWKVLESNSMKSPAFVFTLISLQIGSLTLSYSGKMYQLSL